MIHVSTDTPDYSAEAVAEPLPATDPVALETPLLAAPESTMDTSKPLPALRSYILQHPMAAVLAAVMLGFVLTRSLARDR